METKTVVANIDPVNVFYGGTITKQMRAEISRLTKELALGKEWHPARVITNAQGPTHTGIVATIIVFEKP